MRSFWEPSSDHMTGVADPDHGTIALDNHGNRRADSVMSVDHNGNRPVGAGSGDAMSPVGDRSPLPRGSSAFQEVLREITEEKEAERQKLLNITQMMKPKKEELKTEGDRTYRHAGLWKLASVKVMKRTPSQKSELGLKWNLKT